MVDILRRLGRLVDGLSTAVGYLSGGAFLLLAFYMSWEVLARKWGLPYTAVSDEISGYVMAVGGTWGMAYALRHGGHVRIEALVQLFPALLQRVLSTIALALTAVFAGMLAYYSWQLAGDSAAIGARSISMLKAPVAVPQGMMAAGLTLLALQAALLTLIGGLTLGEETPPEVVVEETTVHQI